MTERSGALQEDLLYMSYAQIAAKSCGEEEEEGGDEEGGEEGEGTSIHVSKLEFCLDNCVYICVSYQSHLCLKNSMDKLMVTKL